MDYENLLKKYEALLKENEELKIKLKKLSNELFVSDVVKKKNINKENQLAAKDENQTCFIQDKKTTLKNLFYGTQVNNYSTRDEKVQFFMSLFKGRGDVFAKRWENRKGQAGYMPVCNNEWITGICEKPQIKCSQCKQRRFVALNAEVIEKHLLGEVVVGIYAMNKDETCSFLAMDFDKEGWEKDISTIRKVCGENSIPHAVERSRSGNGGHVWFFFKTEISTVLARKFGTAILTYSMKRRYEIQFSSYDRLFPNQDTMPKGGFGNLIALPLQKTARKLGNSVFIDTKFQPYPDQWAFLSEIRRISEDELVAFCKKMVKDNELGQLKNYETDEEKPWKSKSTELRQADFPENIEMVKSELLYINKKGLNPRLLNTLKRFAAFRNPDFYKTQAMRLPTYNKSRVVSCSEDFEKFLALPRGCEDDIKQLVQKTKTKLIVTEETCFGNPIKVEFLGQLRPSQQDAVNALFKNSNGVLSATTAFGKTVIGAALIAKRKVNTLVLVHRQQLLAQWKERLTQFLDINENPPEHGHSRRKKRKPEIIGQLGAGKNQLNFIVDIAIMQSLNSKGEINDCVKNYGMVIVDECHHIPAFSFEQILKKVKAKYIYGLTATPIRPDGHHPIIFYYCGPVRFLADAKEEAEKRPFEHILIPRFTSFKLAQYKKSIEYSIQEVYAELVGDETRNQAIIDDVVENYNQGRNSLVLSGRVKHVSFLVGGLKKNVSDVISLTGGMGINQTREAFERISSIPVDKPFVIVATGSFIGEGFDEPRLDTLFLTLPIAWKGTLQQYVGRLHRLHANKKEVQVFDYVDIHVSVLEKMYQKRLKGYAATGYKARAEIGRAMPVNIIFNKESFYSVYLNDLKGAKRSVVIVSPYLTQKRIKNMLPVFVKLINQKIEVEIITRPTDDFPESKKAILQNSFTMIKEAGIKLTLKSKFHQKYAIIDQKICWYGSINLLSFGWSEESIMRIVSTNIAYELEKSKL